MSLKSTHAFLLLWQPLHGHFELEHRGNKLLVIETSFTGEYTYGNDSFKRVAFINITRQSQYVKVIEI